MTARHFRIGLTGSIGMGKSTVLAMFAAEGLPTWDADAAVARLYGPDGAGSLAVEKLAPECVDKSGVDRACLSQKLAETPALLKKLEAAVHPLVAKDREAFAQSVASWAAVYDIPLLFETGAEDAYDKVVVVSAPPHIQRERVLARDGMTDEKFDFILSRQIPDAQKRSRADVVIDTGAPLDETKATVTDLVHLWKAEHA